MIEPPRRRRRWPWLAAALVAGVAVVLTLGALSWTGAADDDEPLAPAGAGGLHLLPEPIAIVDTLTTPIDGTAGDRLEPGRPLRIEGSRAGAEAGDSLLLDITTSAADEPGLITVAPCGSGAGAIPTADFVSDSATSHQLLVALGDAAQACVETTAGVHLVAEALGRLTPPAYDAARPGTTLLDTERVEPGEPLRVAAVGQDGTPSAPVGMVALAVLTAGRGENGSLTVGPCDTGVGRDVPIRADGAAARTVVVPVDGNGNVCVRTTVTTDATVALVGSFASDLARPVDGRGRIVDTRPDGETLDGRFAGIGVRPESSTLVVQAAERADAPADATAALIEVRAVDPLESGRLDAFTPQLGPGRTATLHYTAGSSSTALAAVPIGAGGEVCVSTTGRTDLIVDLVGWLVAPAPSPGATDPAPSTTAGADVECPQQSLFPDRRIVAMYGTGRTPRLGVLGEQDAEAAAVRLDQIAEPWRAGDRPVLPAFELIATLATSDIGDDGLHRLQSSPEVVQEYLDVARRHGYYLILDIQPGWSDFLTEAQYYEEFLRQPDVGLALDPEWHTRRPNPPAGGFVGQTTAAEVNAVTEWLAQIVTEEELPEKLLVVHQFQERMVLDRDQLVEPPGIALTIHMDGFGTRGQKQHTWSLLRADEPWSNGLKLFYDEDIDMYRPDEVLAGAFDPVPDLITYQ